MMPRPQKETILKTLILIGIIAIIASLYIQYGKPYIKELSLQKQDEQRIKDLDTLSGMMKDMIAASSTQFIGNNNTIYISIPSDNSNCANLDLPSVPEGWQYHCVATSTLHKTDGTGWIPVKLSEKIKQLPIDPTNNPETLNYYAYVASSTNEYVFTGVLDSKNLLKSKAQNDGGVDSIRYEVGKNLFVWSDAVGLIGYWPIKERGKVLKDLSGNSNNGIIFNDPIFNLNSPSNKSFIKFSANLDYVKIKSEQINQLKRFTVATYFLVDPDSNSNTIVLGNYGGNAKGFQIRQENNSIVGTMGMGNGSNIDLISKNEKGKWYFVTLTFDGESLSLYVNGKIKESREVNQIDMVSGFDINIGKNAWDSKRQLKGEVGETRIYQTSLSRTEILKMYASFNQQN